MRMLTVAVASLALAAPAAAVVPKPTLVIVKASATLRGAHFEAGEIVRISVVDSTWTKTVHADTNGKFAVSLAAAHLPHCSVALIRASGNHGSKASVLVRPPECNNQ